MAGVPDPTRTDALQKRMAVLHGVTMLIFPSAVGAMVFEPTL